MHSATTAQYNNLYLVQKLSVVNNKRLFKCSSQYHNQATHQGPRVILSIVIIVFNFQTTPTSALLMLTLQFYRYTRILSRRFADILATSYFLLLFFQTVMSWLPVRDLVQWRPLAAVASGMQRSWTRSLNGNYRCWTPHTLCTEYRHYCNMAHIHESKVVHSQMPKSIWLPNWSSILRMTLVPIPVSV